MTGDLADQFRHAIQGAGFDSVFGLIETGCCHEFNAAVEFLDGRMLRKLCGPLLDGRFLAFQVVVLQQVREDVIHRFNDGRCGAVTEVQWRFVNCGTQLTFESIKDLALAASPAVNCLLGIAHTEQGGIA